MPSGAGKAAAKVAGQSTEVGQIFRTTTGSTEHYYVMRSDGLALVNATEYALLAARPGAPAPRQVGQADIAVAPVSAEHATTGRVPDLTRVRPLEGGTVCVTDLADGRAWITMAASETGGIVLPAGGGVLAVPDSGRTEYLITEQGLKYRIADTDAARALGFEDTKHRLTLPAGVLARPGRSGAQPRRRREGLNPMARLRLRSTPVGDVLLIHPKGRYDDRAAAFASGIAEDPLHTLVVVDLPADALATEWEGGPAAVVPRHGSPRLVFGRGTGDDIRTACRLLAERLEREVLAPDGDLVPTVTGGLFVPGDDGAAWLRFRPGRDPELVAQRYPKPHWEFTAPTRTGPAGAHTVAQPVPAGVWLRHTDHDPLAARHHRAVETVPTDPHLFLLVLGSPGTPPLALDDVAQFWDTVLPGVRPAARFVLHGSLDTPCRPRTGPDPRRRPQPPSHPVRRPALRGTRGPARPRRVHLPALRDTHAGDHTGFGAAARTRLRRAVPAAHSHGVGRRRAARGNRHHRSPETLTSPDDSGDTDLSEAPTVRNDGGTQLPAPAPAPAPEPATNGAADLEEAPTIRNARRTRAGKTPDPTPAPAADPAGVPDPASEAPRTPPSVPTSTPSPIPAEAPATPSVPVVPRPSPHLRSHSPTPPPHPPPSPAPAPRLAPPIAPPFSAGVRRPEPEPSVAGDVGTSVAAVTPAAATGTGPAPGTTPVIGGAGAGLGVRVQPVPRAAACALPPERGSRRSGSGCAGR